MPKANDESRVSAMLAELFKTQRGVITATQLAETLGVNPRTIQKRAADPDVAAVRAGRVFLLWPEQVEKIRAALADPSKRGPKAHNQAP